MKKQLIIVGITLVLLFVGISGCVQQETGLESDNEPIINEDTPFVGWVRQLIEDNEFNQQKLSEALGWDNSIDIYFYSDRGKNMMMEAESKMENFTNLSETDLDLVDDVEWYVYYYKGDYADVNKSQEYYEAGNYEMSETYLDRSRDKLDKAYGYWENIVEKIN